MKFKTITAVVALVGAAFVYSAAVTSVNADHHKKGEKKAAPAKKVDEAAVKAAGPAGVLEGHRFEFPCKGKMPEKPKNGAGCASAIVKGDPNKTDNFTETKTFGGDKGKSYNVTIRFRGVVEPMMYKDGKQDEKDHRFYVGGEPNNKTYNIYKIEISSPKAHYFLNRDDKVGHRIFTIDYTKTFKIDAGATIVLSGDGQNGKLISNFKKLTIEGIDKKDKAYHGQYIQMDVVKVEEAK
jgi:hypothetical protein